MNAVMPSVCYGALTKGDVGIVVGVASKNTC